MIKPFLLRTSIFLAVAVMLNIFLTLWADHYAYRYPRQAFRIQQLLSKADTIDALLVGHSHAQSFDFETMGFTNGYAIWQGGNDVFEVKYQLTSLLPRLPNVKTVFFVISYFSFYSDNATIPNRLVIRRRDYTSIPSFSWVEGDFVNFMRTKFLPVVREDHWEEVFYGMLTGKKSYTVSSLEKSLGVNSYGQLIHEMYFQHKTLDALITLTRDIEVPEQLRQRAEMVKNHPNLIQDVYRTLVSIIQDLQERDIRVIFYTPPYFYLYNELYDQEMIATTRQNMRSLQEEFDVEYYDFSTDPAFTTNHLFYHDDDHMNKDGAVAFSKRFKQIISERF